MSKPPTIEIRCEHCGKWLRSPIAFGDSTSFDLSTLEGNITNCPHCGKMTGCNKENMRLRDGNGGFLGEKT